MKEFTILTFRRIHPAKFCFIIGKVYKIPLKKNWIELKLNNKHTSFELQYNRQGQTSLEILSKLLDWERSPDSCVSQIQYINANTALDFSAAL